MKTDAYRTQKAGEYGLHPLEKLLKVEDLWNILQKTPKPILLYGMGDGADKILDVCQEKNIPVRGVFASDDFVRGQSFRGFPVKTYRDIKNDFSEPVILVSFATRLDSVLKKIYNLHETDELYAPDVPVFGGGLFDSAYFSKHFDKFCAVYDLLADQTSREVYYRVLEYKLTGRIEPLKCCETSPDEAYRNIIRPQKGSVYVDIGAYNGDTLSEYVSYAGREICAYAFEPDARNYKKLCETVETLCLSNAHLYNLAAWNEKTELTFYARSGRNSAGTTSHKGAKARAVPADRADVYLPQGADFVNIDAEGSDMQVLLGLTQTIRTSRPTVSCALYHRNEDMFAIPLYLAGQYQHFHMYVRHFPYIPAWDTNVYITDASPQF